MRTLNNINSSSAYKFIMPFMIAFILINLVPYIIGFYMSFNYWYLLTVFNSENVKFVGVENYALLFEEKEIVNDLLYVVNFVSMSFILIHVTALLFSKLITSCISWVRAWILMGLLVPFVVAKFSLQQNMYSIYFIYEYLEKIFWFLDEQSTLRAVLFESVVMTYKFFGFFTLIYYMVLKSVPQNIIEAARLDGASAFRVYLSIEVPHMKKMIYMMCILSVVMLVGESNGLLSILNFFWFIGDMGMASAFTWSYIGLIFTFLLIGYLCVKVLERRRKN